MRGFAMLSSVIAAGGLSLHCHSQSYPVKPIRMINAFAPGGASDVVARNFAGSSPNIWDNRSPSIRAPAPAATSPRNWLRAVPRTATRY